jgi:hypothetical protein
VAYFFSMTTELGKNLVEFLHIYMLVLFSATLNPIKYRSIYAGLLMLPPYGAFHDEPLDTNTYVLLCLSIPLAVLYLLALLGFAAKKWAPRQRTVLENVLYEELVYASFLKLTDIFEFNLLFNSMQFIKLLNGNHLPEMA